MGRWVSKECKRGTVAESVERNVACNDGFGMSAVAEDIAEDRVCGPCLRSRASCGGMRGMAGAWWTLLSKVEASR